VFNFVAMSDSSRHDLPPLEEVVATSQVEDQGVAEVVEGQGIAEASDSGQVSKKRPRGPFDFAWDTDEDGEFTPFTQSRSPPKKVFAKKSSPLPLGQTEGVAKTGRGPSDCLNWDESDEDIFASVAERKQASKARGKKSAAAVKKKNVAKNTEKQKRVGLKAKGKSLGKFFCFIYLGV
jgi:hypothetical protein